MPTGIQTLNDKLARAGDNDLLFFYYPSESAVTKTELLTQLKPELLPPSHGDEGEPEPIPLPPPPPIVTDEMGVAWTTLRVRAGPSVAARQIGLLYLNQVVRVQGSTASGEYHFAQLLSVNGVKFADVGYVAREGLAPKV